MSWTSVSDSVSIKRTLSPDEQSAVTDVLDMAAAWRAGELPAYEVARLSTGRIRALAFTTTPDTDPRRAALGALQDALTDASGYVRTNHGTYARSTLGEFNVVVHPRSPEQST